ncbi:Bug family tripartite tricarboxylate transporter substrate binding protein [Heyndrickxia sporothermodurans]|uniref:Tripartite tricarboxylate transporter substrate binding protein n=1 Tax=Heyndrickxia sporothermodurans TaxID=46224 RepID=A0AB37HH59_9BACI|nr:tripartite tricarboxylate transporter substrate binding protein [Heyndrickxia sporothermodurans]MBL5771718.1 tripartite tricarboxylate transporter substrate binding protein [Heyndrickxia sporothermodurans]MBL5775330.1 tripartite tricarboxylate transporter substrate binding protein [Heyndrickxia sporothermodurans]MBL5778819.1 tripartite tricarboxylate transporter substrate binding protein [Heyndrickxia sporothermodurans]MBL5785987.1 tripartite tricarboxylate transporter substrate binding prot
MLKMKKISTLLCAGALALSLGACSSDGASGTDKKKESTGYPKKAISVVAPSGAGGGWDLTARSFTKVLSETKLVEVPMTVENKPGGGGAVFMAEYATQQKSNNDMLFVNSPPIIINNLKKEGNSPYGYKNTTPLAQLTKDYGAIVVKADSKFKDLKSVLEEVKKNPSKLTFAGGSALGSMDHLVAILPAFKYGVDPTKVKYVSYDGGGEAITALLGGNADVIGTDASSVQEFLKAGKVRVLAITASERLEGEFKDIPTAKEQGVDAEFTIWRGVFGPEKMSDEAKSYWEKTIGKLVETPEWKKEVETQGWEMEYKNSEEFKKFLDEQETQVQQLLEALGMQK